MHTNRCLIFFLRRSYLVSLNFTEFEVSLPVSWTPTWLTRPVWSQLDEFDYRFAVGSSPSSWWLWCRRRARRVWRSRCRSSWCRSCRRGPSPGLASSVDPPNRLPSSTKNTKKNPSLIDVDSAAAAIGTRFPTKTKKNRIEGAEWKWKCRPIRPDSID